MTSLPNDLEALATHLAARRAALLSAWRQAIRAHPDLNTGASLPRSQLNDHIPALLQSFEDRLTSLGSERNGGEQLRDAAAHGLQRWHQGYDLKEVVREWAVLHPILLDEIETYFETHPDADRVARVARRALAELVGEGVCESTVQYFRLEQIEAAGHVRDLETALVQLRELEAERGAIWQQAAHDLRGNLSVVSNVAHGFNRLPEARRNDALEMLRRNVKALHHLLDDATALARLQAGKEERTIGEFDAAALLRDLCRDCLPLAKEKGLHLRYHGPTHLRVEGDPIKTRRIAQNLLLNAIKYTLTGGIELIWSDGEQNDPKRWVLIVRDSGPGLRAGPGSPLAAAIEQATEASHDVDEAAETGTPTHASSGVEGANGLADRPAHQEPGEGIGLSIVKRLCEMLDATVEAESVPGVGTTFRVLLPRSYPTVAPID
jgi:signal transduction histidine kinase